MLTLNSIKEIEREVEKRMGKCIEATQREFKSIRTGRASTALVEGVMVDYYGTPTPLKGLGNLSTPDPKTVVISPWDASILGAIEKSLQQSDLGVNPLNDGKCIRIQVPPITEERRLELTKVVRRAAEDGRISVRNSRHEGIEAVKRLEKSKQISEDESMASHKHIQKLTDDFTKKIDEIVKSKETELSVL